MTEDEAKTKWCCGPKILADAILAIKNSSKPAPADANGVCVASACMAWRREKVEFSHVQVSFGSEGEKYTEDQHGFCGLAGKP